MAYTSINKDYSVFVGTDAHLVIKMLYTRLEAVKCELECGKISGETRRRIILSIERALHTLDISVAT